MSVTTVTFFSSPKIGKGTVPGTMFEFFDPTGSDLGSTFFDLRLSIYPEEFDKRVWGTKIEIEIPQ